MAHELGSGVSGVLFPRGSGQLSEGSSSQHESGDDGADGEEE
jgi:hypothetical protein